MFGIILISVTTVMHIYVCWRTATVPFVQRNVPLPVLIGVGVVLWGAFFSSAALSGTTEPAWQPLSFLKDTARPTGLW